MQKKEEETRSLLSHENILYNSTIYGSITKMIHCLCWVYLYLFIIYYPKICFYCVFMPSCLDMSLDTRLCDECLFTIVTDAYYC